MESNNTIEHDAPEAPARKPYYSALAAIGLVLGTTAIVILVAGIMYAIFGQEVDAAPSVLESAVSLFHLWLIYAFHWRKFGHFTFAYFDLSPLKEYRKLFLFTACALVASYGWAELFPEAYENASQWTLETLMIPPVFLSVFLVVVLAPVLEELIFRQILHRAFLENGMHPALVAILTAAGWALLHVQYEIVVMLELFAMGLFLSYMRMRYNSLLAPIFIHAINNAVASVWVYYFL